MSDFKISLSGGNNVLPSPWADLKRTQTSPITLPDETGADVGVTVKNVSAPPFEVSTLTTAQPGTGDASWVIAEALEGGHGTDDTVNWEQVLVEGLAPGDVYQVDCFSSYEIDTGRDTEFRVNGGASQVLPNDDGTNANVSEIVSFPGTAADANGEILIEYRKAASAFGRSYANAIQLKGAGPTLTVTQTELTPGGTISGSYSGYSGVPVSPLTLTDSAGNSITVAVTITDNGDGTGSFTFTMPALPAAGNSQSSLLFGDVTAELTT